ncbi:flagellar hook protein FlgE [Dasania sp. GY-MA-18]|uniref:Flagellar hook protein FlgE n=1 Tax=Dasania phycosphaerae TaxID=2950436 RepID=A0A9J6RHI4_9GAMM|nr:MULTISPECIES: flagellar hook protein FlgE [Dasania]MCR8921398.1 flagellar hook protein FlgE [Dasania sp. GY-MA-18]MCZ0863826.1 flagellar hook protein FlgE [Dasania phycosphaerae]MCZ0867554.1 flagellar hook protein FlgE [Dasania phycosphaerae]
MSFNTALSGLRAANQDLSVTGNNIANASTAGFKESRAEFGDVYANSLIGSGSTAGSGVLVTDVAQQFDQGNISFTDNSLDLAINGTGMFVLSDAGATTYSRAGYFGLDKDGYIVANNSARLQGYQIDSSGAISTGVTGDLQIQTQNIAPASTSAVDIEFNLDSRASAPAVTPFDYTDPDSYNTSTSLTVYDSLGNPHVQTNYFVKDPAPAVNQWQMYVKIDDQNVIAPTAADTPITLTFASDGTLASPLTPTNITAWDPIDANGNSTGAITPSPFTISVGSSTQFGSEFSVTAVGQDGFSPGRLSSVEVDKTGVIFARYTNGEAQVLGQLALATFGNQQGLTPLGNTSWGESFESGQPIIGAPLTGSLGAIQSGALEDSNVDLSEELVRLIIAQRNFQANAKTIETSDTVTQAIINIR